MTANQFDQECTARNIDPGVALEDLEIESALLERDDEEVIRLLDENF